MKTPRKYEDLTPQELFQEVPDLVSRLEDAGHSYSAYLLDYLRSYAIDSVSRDEHNKLANYTKDLEQALKNVEWLLSKNEIDPFKGISGQPDDMPSEANYIDYGAWSLANEIRRVMPKKIEDTDD